MNPYAVQVHLYGSVAVLTLCAGRGSADNGASLNNLLRALEAVEGSAGSLVLDLDHAPYPFPADALAAVDAWAVEREITLVVLSPPRRPTGMPRTSSPGPRPAAHLANGRPRGAPDDEPSLARELLRILGIRALVHRAAGVGEARHEAHPCS
ncbi:MULTISPECIES: hypothetical protein [unclassified Streptomyces]|uniref:hypothetical protein n=1 Tax=unclassified Streptomyces TaxID=2593676 RepID=UPI000DC76761|nr:MULTISPECIES: hypothetical protein [unclassified Streptomyces]AWZ09181.1 hypothetical protein DRB89_36990 [Streptomyces sp. ICC4]AWZ16548.1 hypothetical protein DRB96_34970 [Streptomyces sp. ICC1]